jgi:hypothetical protein
MTVAAALPGITFDVVSSPLDEALPRMDVCGFVGFASRGPIDVPVAVEDPIGFREVFGSDPVVAFTEEGVDVRAHLGPAVEAFFANGGARAWVVRVARTGAEGAVTNRFAVPGVLMPGAGGVTDWRLLTLDARSPGAWSDGLTAGATLSVTSVVATLDGGPGRVVVDHGVDVVPGDLLRLLLGHGRELRVVVTAVVAHPDGRAVSFDPAAGWLIDERPPLPPAGTAYRIGVGPPVPLPSLEVELGSVDPEITAWVADDDAPAPGDVVAFTPATAGGPLTLLAIGGEHVDPAEVAGASGPSGRRFVLTGAWEVSAGTVTWMATLGVPRQVIVEVQRLRLLVRDGQAAAGELDGLGLGGEHQRAVAALPPDDLTYSILGGARRRQLVDDTRVDTPFDRALTAFEREATASRFPLAAVGRPQLLLPLTITTDPTEVVFGPPPGAIDTAPTPVRNGLETFGAHLFVDEELAGRGVDTILAAAWDVTSVRRGARRLTGIHALATNDDVTLVCVPDAVHTGWDRIEATLPRSLVAPQLDVRSIDKDGAHLQWAEVGTATGYEIEQDADPAWSLSTRTAVAGADRVTAVLAPREGCPHYEYARVRARRRGELGPWSNTVGVLVPAADFTQCTDQVLDVAPPEKAAAEPRPQIVWRSRTPSEAAPWEDLRAIQTATLRWCAARGDVLAVLAMPAAFTADDALRHLSVLRGAEAGPVLLPVGVRRLDSGEAAVLGYGALYHPWPVVGRADVADGGGARAVSPDGAIAGTYAARALIRGVWIAPARVPLNQVLALTPAVDPARHLALVAAGVNPIADDPSGFMTLTAATMTDEAAVRPVNVRRLIMLLRRLALRAGDGTVFEPNDHELQRLVHMRFERLLLGMFQSGAFAGAVPAEAFEISIGDNVNPAGSIDLGRFVIEVRFAPSRPLEFITVRLVLAGVPGGEARP